MLDYYSSNFISKRSKVNSIILNALAKYNYESFSLKILEIINIKGLNNTETRSKLLEKKQYYIDLLNPKYNILKIAGSNLGSKLSKKAKFKISKSKKGKNSHRKGIKLQDITKELIKINNAMNKKVYVYSNDKRLIKECISIQEASGFTNINRYKISRVCNSNKLKIIDNKIIYFLLFLYFNFLIIFDNLIQS